MGKKFPSCDCYLTYEDYEKALKNREIKKYKGKRFESALDCYKNNLVFNKVTKKWIKRSNVDNNIKSAPINNNVKKPVCNVRTNEEEEDDDDDDEESESSTEELESTFSLLTVSNCDKENYSQYSTNESHFVPLKQSVVDSRLSIASSQNQQSNVMMTFSRVSTQSSETNKSKSSNITPSINTKTITKSSSSSSSSPNSSDSFSLQKHKSSSSSPSSPPSPPVILPTTLITPLPLPLSDEYLSGEKVRIENEEKNIKREKVEENNDENVKIKSKPNNFLPSSSCKERQKPMTIIQPQLKQITIVKKQPNNQLKEEIKNISIVFDTNYYLDYLDNIESYLKRALKIYNSKHSTLQSTMSILQPYYYMIVPQQVIVELDCLKLNSNNNTASKARKASRMLVDSLSQYKNKILFLQNDSEIYYGKGIHENPSVLKNDDRILNCALYYYEVKKDDVYLVTGDNVLVLKCASYNIKCYNDREFVVFMNDKLPLF